MFISILAKDNVTVISILSPRNCYDYVILGPCYHVVSIGRHDSHTKNYLNRNINISLILYLCILEVETTRNRSDLRVTFNEQTEIYGIDDYPPWAQTPQSDQEEANINRCIQNSTTENYGGIKRRKMSGLRIQ